MKKDVKQKILGVTKMPGKILLSRHQTLFFQYLFRSLLQPAGKWPSQEVFTGGNFNYSVFQGHKRKNWKVRRFVLRADPAFLHYYDPTKVREWGVTTPRNALFRPKHYNENTSML